MGGDAFTPGKYAYVEKTRDTKTEQPVPKSYEDARIFKDRFPENGLEQRLLGFEKSWRHTDDWQHMPYQLAGEDFPTVGYGHALQTQAERAKLGFDEKKLHPKGTFGGKRREYKDMRIPESQAQQWFMEDVSKAKAEAIRIAENQGVNFKTLPPASQQAIAEMVYQMGASNVINFPSMWEGYRNGDLGRVQEEMLDSNWAQSQTPKRANSVVALLDDVDQLPRQNNEQADRMSLKYRQSRAERTPGLGD